MEFSTMTIEELESRKAQIAVDVEADGADLDALETEIRSINEELETRKANEAKKADIRAKVASGDLGTPIEKTPVQTEERKTMTNAEIRNSAEYIEAFAKYVKTGKDAECRALLTENVEGTVPVPGFVENRIRNAWENDEIFSRVAKTYVKGNLRVGFELSATDAAIHTEGDMTGPAEETLTLGIVNMVPEMIKKWITVSDEVLAIGAADFLSYIYDELTYKIVQKAADIVVAKIVAAPAASDAEHVGVARITGAVSAETIIDALAALGDNARNNVLIASGATIATVRKAVLAAHFAYDPFAGLTVIQKDGVTGAIIGDLTGVQANLPEGDSVTFKFDDLSLAEHDMVKIVGRLYAAIDVVGPKMLARILGE